MAYWTASERDLRIEKVRAVLRERDLDLALVYYDELNIANGWYLTGWCPQFEKGAVLIPRQGEAMILGGPESEPFAKQSSAIIETRNLPVFMVPDEEYPNATIVDFPEIFEELSAGNEIKRVGVVGMSEMPCAICDGLRRGFSGVELLDITEDYQALRYVKDEWERQQIRQAYKLADAAYQAMVEKIAPGVAEIEVAAAGEYAARNQGANGFGFTAIVGSGERSDAVVPTASDRKMRDGETVMIGLAPKWNGYVGVFGNTLPVGGHASDEQAEAAKRLSEAFCLTKEMLVPGKTGLQIDIPARQLYEKIGWVKYIVCPFAHSTGLSEVESPFFGPSADDPLEPGMTVCVDVSFFGHPTLHGARIETGYEITNNGPVPLSPMMDDLLTGA